MASSATAPSFEGNQRERCPRTKRVILAQTSILTFSATGGVSSEHAARFHCGTAPPATVGNPIGLCAKNISSKETARKNQFVEQIQQIYPTGKSLQNLSSFAAKNILIFRNL
jgi:hypothetical protein